MAGYSGDCSFTYTIERFRDTDTNQYIDHCDVEDDDFGYSLEMIDLKVSGSAYYRPGKYSAAPEDCYPDESDVEVDSVIGPDNQDWYCLLSQKEIEDIETQIVDMVSSGDTLYDNYDYDNDYCDNFDEDCFSYRF